MIEPVTEPVNSCPDVENSTSQDPPQTWISQDVRPAHGDGDSDLTRDPDGLNVADNKLNTPTAPQPPLRAFSRSRSRSPSPSPIRSKLTRFKKGKKSKVSPSPPRRIFPLGCKIHSRMLRDRGRGKRLMMAIGKLSPGKRWEARTERRRCSQTLRRGYKLSIGMRCARGQTR